ncbi:hypothetical protein CR513_12194, partial [Mucuna pruriens]
MSKSPPTRFRSRQMATPLGKKHLGTPSRRINDNHYSRCYRTVSPCPNTSEEDLRRKVWQSIGPARNQSTTEALLALTQYYDPPLRCFTFRDFWLVPTLEEYERILAMPLTKAPPYLFKGQYPSWATISKLLRMSESKIREEKKSRNGLESILRANLEEDHIDLASIDTFLAKRDRGENLVIAILANTYYSLNYCPERNGKGLRCYTTLLRLPLELGEDDVQGRMNKALGRGYREVHSLVPVMEREG